MKVNSPIMPERKFDFSSLNEFFNSFMTPKELSNDLVRLMFNYALSFDEDNASEFKNDVSTIYVLYHAIENIK